MEVHLGKRVIVEGVDGSGKTTLVKELIQRVPALEYVRNEKRSEQDFNNWWPAMLKRDFWPWYPIHDRFFYSELIYGPIIRGHIACRPEVAEKTQEELRASALLIYARPPLEVMREEAKKNDQMDGVHTHFDLLAQAYDLVLPREAKHYGGRFYEYNWLGDYAIDQVSELVRRYLRGELK